MHSASRFFARLLVALRWPLLAVAVTAAALAFAPSRRLGFDRSIENMFAAADPLLLPYLKLKRTFGGNEVVMVVYRDPHLLDEDGSGIERLGRLGDQIKKVPGVAEILSLAELDRSLGSVLSRGIASRESPVARRVREVFQGYTHGADGQTAAVVCILTPEDQSRIPRRETIGKLRRVIQSLPPGSPDVMIGGEPVLVEDGFNYVERDGQQLGRASTLLLALVIILCFRSVRWVIIPIAIVQFALLLTRATLVWSRLDLSMVSSMLSAIVTVVGVATVVHVLVRFREGRRSGLAPRAAITAALARLAMPVFWACTTDAVGFASLLVTRVRPVQDFGLMMAIGSLWVVASVALLVPGLALWKLPRRLMPLDYDPQPAWREGDLQSALRWLIGWVERRPGVVAVGSLLVMGIAAAGVFRVELESDFTKNFRQGSPIVRSYRFIESHLGGAGAWDVVLPAPRRLHWAYLSKALRLERRLREQVVLPGPDGKPRPGLTKVISIADLVTASSPFDLGKVRFGRGVLVSASISRMRAALPAFMDALYGQDPLQPGRRYFRIMLRARERQSSADKRSLIEQVERICREEWPTTEGAPGAEVTGFFVLLTHLIDSLLADQWLAFAVAAIGIGLMIFVAMLLSDVDLARSLAGFRAVLLARIVLRSAVTAAVMLVPNALPIVMVLGLMGWMGIKINMGAAMIAAVSMGLSIDSSIHYTASFRHARAAGKCVADALAEVQRSVGLAVVFSTLALIVGFTILCASNFVPTIYFGLLVGLSMLGGLFGNLLVLPLLLRFVTPDGDQSKTA